MNIIAIDQELLGLAVVVNGVRSQINTMADLVLPSGGGVVVADANVWAVNNGLSQSQYCFPSSEARENYLFEMSRLGYKSISVSTKYAKVQYIRRGFTQADAVEALYDEVVDQIATTGRFDSGKPVRESRGDISFGQREVVVRDFLLLQNNGGYTSDFLSNAIEIIHPLLTTGEKRLLNMKIRTAECTSPNRLGAVLVCTHDPETGLRREYNGRPWGVAFITKRILCLNGMMQGTGVNSPGSPMRAVLRILGRRHSDKVNREERKQLDALVKKLIRELQKHPKI